MDLYGDLDLYTNVPPVPGAGLGFQEEKKTTNTREKPVAEKKAAVVESTADKPADPPTTMKSGLSTTSALKFIPHIRRREDPKPGRPNPINAQDISKPAPPTRNSPAASSLKTALGMAAFTPVSVIRKPTKETVPVASPQTEFEDEAERFKHHVDNVREEYDPFRPNDYASYCDEREIKRKNAEVRRDLELRQRRLDEQRERERKQLEKDLEAGRVPNLATTSVPGGRGRGMNLPAWMMKKIEAKSDTPAVPPPPPPPLAQTSAPGQFNDAYDEAPRGLGFSSQPTASSASTPTQHGLGFVPSSAPPAVPCEEPSKKPRVSRFGQRVSRFDQKEKPAPLKTVLLLLNMVAPGDVDNELQDEVKEECESKYGPVKKCLVHEVKHNVHPEEAVRIFVEFQTEADANRALIGLNGRFFAGRKLSVSVFDKTKYDRMELAP